jgi:hypothetical protein
MCKRILDMNDKDTDTVTLYLKQLELSNQTAAHTSSTQCNRNTATTRHRTECWQVQRECRIPADCLNYEYLLSDRDIHNGRNTNTS